MTKQESIEQYKRQIVELKRLCEEASKEGKHVLAIDMAQQIDMLENNIKAIEMELPRE